MVVYPRCQAVQSGGVLKVRSYASRSMSSAAGVSKRWASLKSGTCSPAIRASGGTFTHFMPPAPLFNARKSSPSDSEYYSA
jgi:hypothetical protein